MGKHVLDHADPKGEGTRVAEYARIDRTEKADEPGAAAKTLHRRAEAPETDEDRTRAYLKIDRGETP